MQILKVFYYHKMKESKIMKSLIRTNIKNMLLAFIYDYKLACFDDKFSKPFEFCLGEDAILLTILSKKVSTVLI